MNIIKNKTIAIIGGGPGGLMLARILQMNGADVKVYERDANKDAREKGATLDLHEESGLRALREAGLMDAFNANFRPGAEKMRIMDKHACLLWDDDVNGRDGLTRPEIDRGPLQNILLGSLKPGTVIWNSHFNGLSPHNGSWQLAFKNGSSAFADIVVAADGANSMVRPYITSIRPFYAGVTVIEGSVYDSETACPKMHKLLNGGKIFAMGDSRLLVVSSKGDGSMMFYTSCKTNENWCRENGMDFSDKAQVTDWFKREFAGWDDIWLELFENAGPRFICRPQYCMPLDQSWQSLPNLTMLGDAAHLMPPFAGEGVNMAMLDALELGNCLTGDNFPDTLAAITAYEAQMRARASETAKGTLVSTDELHSANAITFLIDIIT